MYDIMSKKMTVNAEVFCVEYKSGAMKYNPNMDRNNYIRLTWFHPDTGKPVRLTIFKILISIIKDDSMTDLEMEYEKMRGEYPDENLS